MALAYPAQNAFGRQATEVLAAEEGSIGTVQTQYPVRALREGAEGRTVYRISVSPEGRVTSCTIIESSGSADLDGETCRMLTENAKFAAIEAKPGQSAERTFQGGITWKIED